MSDNMRVLLVGCGNMGKEYAKVLRKLKADITVVGNSEAGAEKFFAETGIEAVPGGIEAYAAGSGQLPDTAVVATPVASLTSCVDVLIGKGVEKILVEKPAGMDRASIQGLCEKAEANACRIFVAYNRRFYASVKKASEIIEEDGGLSSFNFEFTEWASTIEKTSHPDIVKENWLLANSTHVIDLAFFLGGRPDDMASYVAGGLNWHRNGAVYSGAGRTDKGCLFSYQANWSAPGRWGVEFLTTKHRIYLRPMEKVSIQKLNSVAIEEIEINDELDRIFKPGLYEQVNAFMNEPDDSRLCPIKEHLENIKVYEKIAGINK